MMPSLFHHALFNLVTFSFFAFFASFFRLTTLELTDLISTGFWFTIGGIFFDIDHLLYYLATTRPLRTSILRERMQHDFKHQVPHFYAFHTFEFLALILVTSFYSFLVLNWNAFFFFLGWVLHFLVDLISYIKHYKGLKPWIYYFSAVHVIVARLKRENDPR